MQLLSNLPRAKTSMYANRIATHWHGNQYGLQIRKLKFLWRYIYFFWRWWQTAHFNEGEEKCFPSPFYGLMCYATWSWLSAVFIWIRVCKTMLPEARPVQSPARVAFWHNYVRLFDDLTSTEAEPAGCCYISNGGVFQRPIFMLREMYTDPFFLFFFLVCQVSSSDHWTNE